MTVLDRERGMNETAVYRENESNIRRTTVETTSITPAEDIITGTYSTPTAGPLGQHPDDIPQITVKSDRLGSPSQKDATVGGSPSEEPYPVSGLRSGIVPEMTLKQDRSPASIENGVPLENSSKKPYKERDNINPREETTYPFTPSSEYLMNNDTDIDRLVDRLYTKFERKIRIERERQGL